MIDFLKLYWRDKSKFEAFVLEEGNFEEVLKVLELHSGEIRYPYKAAFSGMDIAIHKNSASVKNSIHKSYNIVNEEEDQNYNDFTYSRLCESIDYISSRLTDMDNSGITKLEFGLNLLVEIPAERLIRRNILMHKLKGANHNRQYYGRGELKQFDHHNYAIKIYDKAKQYDLSSNIIRVEIKFVKAVDYQRLGVMNVEDLKVKKNLRSLCLLLLKRFDELTIIDNYSGSDIEPSDLNQLIRYSNPSFWEEDLRDRSRQTKFIHKRRFEVLLAKYELLKTKEYLRGLIIRKFIHLINR